MKKILSLLKPLVASLGFNEKELEGVAKSIYDNNLELQKEDATDEEINAKINAVIPILRVAQQNSTRVINEKTKTPANLPKEIETQIESGSDKPQNLTEEIAAAMKIAIEPLSKEIASLKAEKAMVSRKKRLEEVVKESGKFGQKVLKDFDERLHKTFDSEEDFENYLESTKTDVSEYVQDEKNRGLSSFTISGGSTAPIKEVAPKKEDLEDIVKNF